MNLLIGVFAAGITSRLFISRIRGNVVPIDGGSARHIKALKILHGLLVTYLLAHIGLIGGAQLAGQGLKDLLLYGGASIAMAMALFVVALWLLTTFQLEDAETRVALASHFGSVSVGTFAAAQAFLLSQAIPFHQSTTALLAIMEIPAIFMGAVFLTGANAGTLRHVIMDRYLIMLMGSLTLGAIAGPQYLHRFDALLVEPFQMVLALFLFGMGIRAGAYVSLLPQAGIRLIGFGILMPLLGGAVGSVTAILLGMSVGDAVLLSTLGASASYITVTAAMSKMLSPKAISTSLMVSLGIALPWNIMVGIPLIFVALTSATHGLLSQVSGPFSSLARTSVIGISLVLLMCKILEAHRTFRRGVTPALIRRF
jgi:hypothetical protein